MGEVGLEILKHVSTFFSLFFSFIYTCIFSCGSSMMRKFLTFAANRPPQMERIVMQSSSVPPSSMSATAAAIAAAAVAPVVDSAVSIAQSSSLSPSPAMSGGGVINGVQDFEMLKVRRFFIF